MGCCFFACLSLAKLIELNMLLLHYAWNLMKIDTLQLKSLFQNVQLTEFQEYKNKMLHFLH